MTKTQKLYQAGLELDEAVKQGANPLEFQQLEEKYQGGSIPVHELLGFEKREPYSCNYHTGGAKGQQLRTIAASLRK